MQYNDIVKYWNDQADEYNQWEELDEAEKINFTIKTTAQKARAVAYEIWKDHKYEQDCNWNIGRLDAVIAIINHFKLPEDGWA